MIKGKGGGHLSDGDTIWLQSSHLWGCIFKTTTVGLGLDFCVVFIK